MKYHGACHCQAVIFEVEMDLKSALECNCSHCYNKGFLLAFVPETSFTLLSGEDMLTEYRFNKKQIAHLFCRACGVQAFGKGESPDGTKTIAVNLRCLTDVDADTLETQKYDGKNL